MDLVRVNSEDVEVDGSVKDFVQWWAFGISGVNVRILLSGIPKKSLFLLIRLRNQSLQFIFLCLISIYNFLKGTHILKLIT
jgi:hypothetical protein